MRRTHAEGDQVEQRADAVPLAKLLVQRLDLLLVLLTLLDLVLNVVPAVQQYSSTGLSEGGHGMQCLAADLPTAGGEHQIMVVQ